MGCSSWSSMKLAVLCPTPIELLAPTDVEVGLKGSNMMAKLCLL